MRNSEDQVYEASRTDLAEHMRKHYLDLSRESCFYNSGILDAIDAWEREPELTGAVEKLKAILRTLAEDASEVRLAYSDYSDAIRSYSFYDGPETMRARFRLEDTVRKLAKTLSVVAKVFKEKGE